MTPNWLGVIVNKVGGNVILTNITHHRRAPPATRPRPSSSLATRSGGTSSAGDSDHTCPEVSLARSTSSAARRSASAQTCRTYDRRPAGQWESLIRPSWNPLAHHPFDPKGGGRAALNDQVPSGACGCPIADEGAPGGLPVASPTDHHRGVSWRQIDPYRPSAQEPPKRGIGDHAPSLGTGGMVDAAPERSRSPGAICTRVRTPASDRPREPCQAHHRR